MTYEEIVYAIRSVYEDADARHIFEHIAVQIDIIGEGSGSLYIEVAERAVCVEPYDYHDRDGKIITDSYTVSDILSHKLSFKAALEQKRVKYEGNWNKLETLMTIKRK